VGNQLHEERKCRAATALLARVGSPATIVWERRRMIVLVPAGSPLVGHWGKSDGFYYEVRSHTEAPAPGVAKEGGAS